jgi:hypothetical protein
MTDWSGALAHAMRKHLEQGGFSGLSGLDQRCARQRKDLPPSLGQTTASRGVVLGVCGSAIPRTKTTQTTGAREVVCREPANNPQSFQEVAHFQTTQTTKTTENEVWRADEEERAALVEVGARVPRAWAEGFARLDLASPAPGFSDERWRRLVDDGGRFLDQWAKEAAVLGWSPLDVFGVHPSAPAARYDAMGLVPLISGGEVVALTKTSATIRGRSGRELVYLRRTGSGAVALWDLAGSTTP